MYCFWDTPLLLRIQRLLLEGGQLPGLFFCSISLFLVLEIEAGGLKHIRQALYH